MLAAVQRAVSASFKNPKGQQFLPPSQKQHKYMHQSQCRSQSVNKKAGRRPPQQGKPDPREAPSATLGFTVLFSDPRSISTQRNRSHFLPISFLGAICTCLQMLFYMVILAELRTTRKDFHKPSLLTLFLS